MAGTRTRTGAGTISIKVDVLRYEDISERDAEHDLLVVCVPKVVAVGGRVPVDHAAAWYFMWDVCSSHIMGPERSPAADTCSNLALTMVYPRRTPSLCVLCVLFRQCLPRLGFAAVQGIRREQELSMNRSVFIRWHLTKRAKPRRQPTIRHRRHNGQ